MDISSHDNISYWLGNDILSFALSLLVSGILIPKIILIASRKRLFDNIDERKVHQGIVPRLGGIAFFPAYLFSMALIVAVNLRLGDHRMADAVSQAIVPVYFEVCAIILLYLVGITDDLIGVRYIAKFAVQILSAVLMVSSGVYIGNLYGIFWLHELPVWLAWLFSILAAVYVVNAINLIDGIDGLASGLSTIALVFYCIVFINSGEYLYSLMAAACVGTLFPFFYYNVFGDTMRHKKIFMGDTGALTTGMVLVFCAIALMCGKPDSPVVGHNPGILAVSPLIVPCLDVFRVCIHRLRRRRNPFLPDRCHIHHKLLALGMSQTKAMLAILSMSVAFIGMNVPASSFASPTLILVGDLAIWTSGNILLTRAIRGRERRLGVSLYD